jgi:hypothetical protein
MPFDEIVKQKAREVLQEIVGEELAIQGLEKVQDDTLTMAALVVALNRLKDIKANTGRI